MRLYKQSKGTTLSLKDLGYKHKLFTNQIIQRKYDGAYIQILVVEGKTRFFTSDHKEFYWEDVANMFKDVRESFLLECEYLGGDSKGNLGGRVTSSTATYRANFSKGISNNIYGTIVVFDCIPIEHEQYRTDLMYIDRLGYLDSIFSIYSYYNSVLSIAETLNTRGSLINLLMSETSKGNEGIMVKNLDSSIREGKRTKEVFKLKVPKYSTLLCTGTIDGKGKYEGMIGSLQLVDDEGIKVKVSPRGDVARGKEPSYYIGREVIIKYECKLDTYIQPILMEVL